MQALRWCATIGVMSALLASTAQASSVRLFFSTTGTRDGEIDGRVDTPALDRDPDAYVHPTTARLWLWASPIGDGTTINGLDFRIVVDQRANIEGYNFWNHNLQVANRWEDGGFPGAAGDQGQSTDDLIFVAIATLGVTNGVFAGFDRQYDEASNSTLLGYVDFSGWGSVDIVFNEGSIAAPHTYERTFLGVDDTIGNPGSGAYSSDDREAFIVPEPASLLVFALGAIALRRR